MSEYGTFEGTPETCKCGTRANKMPRCGKRRYRHKCPHGLWCDHGHRLKGSHANHNWSCSTCVAIKREARLAADPGWQAMLKRREVSP